MLDNVNLNVLKFSKYSTQNSAPFDATSLLAEKCAGSSECSWTKDDFALEDPCAGTFKYMKVDYECRDPAQFMIGNDQGKLFEETSRFVDCTDMVNAFSAKIGEVIEQASDGVEHLYKVNAISR